MDRPIAGADGLQQHRSSAVAAVRKQVRAIGRERPASRLAGVGDLQAWTTRRRGRLW